MPDTPDSAPPEPVGSAAEPEAQRRALTAFAPVPRRYRRSHGWSPAAQRAFIEYLADTGSVEQACRMVGLSATSVYRLRRHPDAGEFVAAWKAARAHALDMIEDNAMDRAINGVEVPVFAYGDRIATRQVYNEQLVMFMLRNLAPERYCEGGARGMSAVDKRVLERMKQEWRAEWEAEEREAEIEQSMAVLEEIERTHRNWYAGMSPAARAAYRQFRRIERDTQRWMLEAPEDEDPQVIDAEYEELRAEDRRAPIRRRMEAGGWFVDKVLEGDDEAQAEADRQAVARVRTIKDEGW